MWDKETPMPSLATRTRIVEAADALIHAQGFAGTSFADIAREVGLSRGNFYYHFRTKDEILAGVIARRMEDTRAMLAGWEADSADPAERIGSFIRILLRNRDKIMAHGCPVGTLNAELARAGHPAQPEARRIFTLFRDWLAAQFAALGQGARAERLAMHLLARSQGVAVLANALGDPGFVRDEVRAMLDWLASEISTTEI